MIWIGVETIGWMWLGLLVIRVHCISSFPIWSLSLPVTLGLLAEIVSVSPEALFCDDFVLPFSNSGLCQENVTLSPGSVLPNCHWFLPCLLILSSLNHAVFGKPEKAWSLESDGAICKLFAQLFPWKTTWYKITCWISSQFIKLIFLIKLLFSY